MNWRPFPGAQQDFCSRGEFEVLYGGAAGPGKTDCLVMLATRRIYHPKYRGLILRRTFPQLQEIIDRTRDSYPEMGGIYLAGEHRWHFPAGSTIQIGHMQHENDKYNYQGKQYHFVGFDELTQFTESQYLYLFSRARTVDAELPIRFRSTTNPGGVVHIFCKNRFVDIAPWGETYVDPSTGLSRAFVPGRFTDNPAHANNDLAV